MEQIHISSYEKFFLILQKRYLVEQRSAWVFRGHDSASYSLLPKVTRISHTSVTREKFEKSIFNLFKRQAYPLLKQQPSNDWEWLTLAQHHGLPTRLLDWTYNPFVACYFAVESSADSDGAIFALRATKRLPDKKVAAMSPFEIDKAYKYLPVHVVGRLVIQEGLFTVQPQIEVPLEDSLRSDWKLEKLIIPKESKRKIRYILYRQGIHRASLFPDLDGLAKHLEWQHTVLPEELE